MKYEINCFEDINPQGKVVLCRLDLNSPLDEHGMPEDVYRIERALPSIIELYEKGAKVVLLSHQGGDLEYHNYGSTKEHANIIAEKIDLPVYFIDDVCGPAAREKIAKLKNGEILMLDNVRYMAEELTLFETKLKLSFKEQAETLVVRNLSPQADLFMCDAFAAAHRSQPTLVGFPLKLPSFMGRLFENELSALENILQNPARPSVFLFGGSKVQDAFMIMSKVLSDGIADLILTSGLVANIMLIASGKDIGKTSYEFLNKNNLLAFVEISKKMLSNHGGKIILPVDIAFVKNGRQEITVNELPVNELIVDLGKNTITNYAELINKSGTVFINGLAGIFEEKDSRLGTKTLWEVAAKSAAFSVIGGGDSVSAVNKLNLFNDFSYVCTGGGAMVRYLSGEKLPVVKALQLSALKYGALT